LKRIEETYFYSPPHCIQNTTLSIDGREARHLLGALRCQEGDIVTVVDGCGHEFDVSVESISGVSIDGKILGRRTNRSELSRQIVLAQGLGRGSRFDLVVEKATELGVHTILPFQSERSSPVYTTERIERKMTRWRNIAIAAMKQSKRSRLPHIAPLSSFETILSSGMVYDLCLVASETEQDQGLRNVCANQETIETILVLVGPEGGFNPEEIDLARTAGFHTISLGPRRLRAETAGILVVALLAYEFGEMKRR